MKTLVMSIEPKKILSIFGLVVAITTTSMAMPVQAQDAPGGFPMPIPTVDSVSSSSSSSTASSSSSSATSSSSSVATSSSSSTASTAVVVTPNSASDSLATPYFGVNMTACLYSFNWEKFVEDYNKGIKNSNPYSDQGCVRQDNLTTNGSRQVVKDGSKITAVNYTLNQTPNLQKTKYADFTGNNNTAAKTAFGQMPVLGVAQNGNFAAQSLDTYDMAGNQVAGKLNADRNKLEGLNSIYTSGEMDKIFGPQVARTGAPRIISTGPDRMRTTSTTSSQSGSAASQTPIYDGGACYVENGKMKVRTKILAGTSGELPTDPAVYGDPASPIVACKPRYSTNAPEMVLDQNMEIYQFVYQIKYPTQAQCQTLWKIPASQYENNCLKFYRERIGKSYTGKSDGDQVVYTYTFYGMWSSSNTYPYRWGPNGNWKNPDINSPRKTFSTTATEAELRKFYPQNQGLTYAQLKGMYEGYVRGGDGYSIYVI